MLPLAVGLAMLVVVTACGGSQTADRRQASADSRVDAVAPVSAPARDERCPEALQPGREAANAVVRAVPREIRRAFPDIDRRGYRVWAIFTLEREAFGPGLRRSRYIRVAARACGEATARQSWVAVLSFPRAAFAALVPAVAFFARTDTGWHIWYVWFPNMRSSGFPPS
jgi:hypothetical protein